MNLIFDLDSALGIEGGDIDDAIALAYLAGLPEAGGLKLLSMVAGNATLASVIRSCVMLRELFGMEVGLAAGAAEPLERPLRTGQSIVMDNMGERWIFQREFEGEPGPQKAWDAIAAMARQAPIHILATAPLTNVAMFLRQYPELKERVTGMTIMGGWFYAEKRGPEFNFMVDPLAVAEVLASGIPMLIVPLEMTLQTRLTREQIEPWRELGEAGRHLYEGTLSWMNKMKEKHNLEGCHMHDPLAAVALFHPHLYQAQGIAVGVNRETGFTEVIAEDPKSPIRVMTHFDNTAFMDELLRSIGGMLRRVAKTEAAPQVAG